MLRFTAAAIIASSLSAQAANTLTISSCSADAVVFKWTVSGSNLQIGAVDTSDAGRSVDYVLPFAEGQTSLDVAALWGSGQNTDVRLSLKAASAVTATCPSD